MTPDKEVTAYCRIGERSAHTWFVLRELLGYADVRNYDGSWTEWGNLVDVPIEKGTRGLESNRTKRGRKNGLLLSPERQRRPGRRCRVRTREYARDVQTVLDVTALGP